MNPGLAVQGIDQGNSDKERIRHCGEGAASDEPAESVDSDTVLAPEAEAENNDELAYDIRPYDTLNRRRKGRYGRRN